MTLKQLKRLQDNISKINRVNFYIYIRIENYSGPVINLAVSQHCHQAGCIRISLAGGIHSGFCPRPRLHTE